MMLDSIFTRADSLFCSNVRHEPDDIRAVLFACKNIVIIVFRRVSTKFCNFPQAQILEQDFISNHAWPRKMVQM